MSQASADNFRLNLRPLCARKQREVAERAGITREYLNKILQGHAIPSLEIAIRLADAVGVPLESLTGAVAQSPQLSLVATVSVNSLEV